MRSCFRQHRLLAGQPPVVVFSSAGLVGQELAPDRFLATAPVSAFIIGIALATIPAAIIMRRIGRRASYFLGSMIGIVGILISALAIYLQQFYLFTFGTALTGLFWAFLQSYRFAATDIASSAFKNKAISWVMIGGIASAIIGPQTVIWTQDLYAAHLYMATYIAAAILIAIHCVIVVQIRIPKPVIDKVTDNGRSLLEIAKNPVFIVAVLCGAISYSTMAFMMTASPLAMVGCGHSHQFSALGIQWHVLAMYAPSFFTGGLMTRFGKVPVISLGLLLLIGAALIASLGITIYHFWIALVFLGVGWNFGFIGSTAMVTDTYQPEERNIVQGFNDFVVFGVNAFASLSAGVIYFMYGWGAISVVMLPMIAVGILGLVWLTWIQRASVQA